MLQPGRRIACGDLEKSVELTIGTRVTELEVGREPGKQRIGEVFVPRGSVEERNGLVNQREAPARGTRAPFDVVARAQAPRERRHVARLPGQRPRSCRMGGRIAMTVQHVAVIELASERSMQASTSRDR